MIIETNRLIFREWSMQDIDFLVDGMNDFEVAKYLTVPFPYTKRDAIDFVNKHLKNGGNSYYFAIERKEDKQVIGGTNISIKEDGEFRGGIWLHRNFQGKGYGTEMWIARAKFAFDELGAKELVNGFYDFNKRSKKMQQKIGYKIVGEKTNFCPALNSEVREIVTNLKKADFDKYYKNIDFEFFVKDK